MDAQKNMDALIKVVDELDPFTLTESDITEIKKWGADRVGFVLVDMKSQKILFATPGAENIFGYMPDEMTGLDLVQLVPEEFQSIHPTHVEGFNENPIPRSMGRRDRPLSGKQRDGKTFPVEIGLFPRKFKSLRVCLANVVRLEKEGGE
jgi:PAS domain S-box-containing protein